jgi:putative FmdB family regulatory protein
MPIFEYTCGNCGHRFEKLILSAKRAKELRCPECDSQEVDKAISLFGTASRGASRAASAANCAPSG